MGIYLFKVKGRITKTICNSVFIANFAESQNKAIAISITDHAKVSETLNQTYMDVLITFYDVWQRSHRRLLRDVFATSQKMIVATFIWDQCKTSLRLKIRRLIDVLKKGCRHFYFGQIQGYLGQIQDVFETKN